MKAYVLIKTRAGEIKDVVKQLRRVEGVTEAHMTFGPYDAVAVVETTDVAKLGAITASGIQPIPGRRADADVFGGGHLAAGISRLASGSGIAGCLKSRRGPSARASFHLSVPAEEGECGLLRSTKDAIFYDA